MRTALHQRFRPRADAPRTGGAFPRHRRLRGPAQDYTDNHPSGKEAAITC